MSRLLWYKLELCFSTNNSILSSKQRMPQHTHIDIYSEKLKSVPEDYSTFEERIMITVNKAQASSLSKPRAK